MFWLMPLISGLGTWAATGDFKKGLMSGLLGAGIGGIAGALGGAAGAGKAGLDAALATSEVAKTGINAAGAAATGAKSLMGAFPQGAFDVAGKALAGTGGITSAGAPNRILSAGAEFLRNKPVTSGLMLSALTSSALAEPPETPEQRKGERFSDEYETVDRNVVPFTGQPPPGPSTYTRNDGFTPDNPYRYGQYEGEKMFFDNPGLKRGTNGELPPLPEGRGDEDERGIRGILSRYGRERIQHRGYAAGGLLSGPGDGQSDNIPAKGPGGDILLSEGEFVIPADVVAALGAGSTNAGSKRLHTAMNKIRTQAYGSPKQAKRPSRISL